MGKDVFLEIKKILESNKIPFEHLKHDKVHTSQDAAKIRGTSLDEAAKAIVLKVKSKVLKKYEFIQCVLPGNKKIDLKKLKKNLHLKSAGLASPEEVLKKTSCTIGSVPPFGNLFDIHVYVDEEIFKKEKIVFSAGTHYDSIKMNPEDYKKVIKFSVMDLSY